MNYDQAKAIVTELAPDLILDPDAGQPHICVRRTEDGAPFSIMLPNQPLPAPIAYRAAVPEIPGTEAIPATEDAPEIPATIGQPARPEVQARSSESQRDEAELKSLTDSLEVAKRMLP